MNTKRSRINNKRQGAAVVELAICLPVLLLLVFASLEGANMLFLRQATVQAVYEAGKAAAKNDGSQARGVQLAQEILSARGIVADSISFSPNNVDALKPGDVFTATIAVQGDQKSITTLGPFNGLLIESHVTMHKE